MSKTIERTVLKPEQILDGAPMQQLHGGVRDLKLVYPETGLNAQTLCMGVVEIEPGHASPMHRHNCEEVYYVLSGEGLLEIENDEGVMESLALVAGGCSLQRPNRTHRVRSVGSEALRLVVVGGVMLVPLLPTWPTASPYEVFEGNSQNA
jgi:mannose-6-phosphate isomerase-like protein (cupin superfamily)